MNPTAHTTGKILLGTTKNTFKKVSSYKAAVATFPAGTGVRKTTGGAVSKTAGTAFGISLGKDMSDADYIAVIEAGKDVPIRLTADFEPAIGDQVYISETTGLGIASNVGSPVALNAHYTTLEMLGVPEEGGSDVRVALIDFVGGV